jgi:hypothetical protein
VTIQIGDIVGDYRVIEIIGSGGMGSVYKIEHLLTRRIEAMKLLSAGLTTDPERVQRFEREIQVQARLSHPNIAALYNALRNGEAVALIMEYVEGESLQHMLEAGPLPVRIALDYTSQVLSALAYAHGEGVIHRDVAPANIIITRDRVAKLTDFGLAKTANDLRVTTSGAPVGSPWYMSPEQVRGLEPIDGRTDIYATGAVLYEILTGAKLFQAEGAFAVMSAHVDTMPAPPSSRHPAIPRALDAIVMKALAKDPAQRFQSAVEFRKALGSVLDEPRTVAAAARPRLTAATVMLAALPLVAVTAAVGTARLLSRPARVQAHAVSAPPTPAPQAPAAPLPAAPAPASDVPFEQPVETSAPVQPQKPVQRSEQAPVRPSRRPPKPQPNYAIRVVGGEVASPAPTPPPRPVPAPPAPAELPDAPVVALPAAPAPELEPVAADPQGPKAPKPGNRLVRTLGKINPFKKSAKPDNSKQE